jgi:hypothetical protein
MGQLIQALSDASESMVTFFGKAPTRVRLGHKLITLLAEELYAFRSVEVTPDEWEHHVRVLIKKGQLKVLGIRIEEAP